MQIETIISEWIGTSEQCEAVRQFARDVAWEIQPEQLATWDAEFAADHVADELLAGLDDVPAEAEAKLRGEMRASASSALAAALSKAGVRQARVIEAGNGWPRVGDLLRDGDGEVWRLASDTGTIHTSQPGRGNYILGTVARAEEPDSEDDVFAARVEVAS